MLFVKLIINFFVYHHGDTFSLAFFQDIRDFVPAIWIYDFEYGLQTFADDVESFVGDGLLCEGGILWEMSAVGAFNSFLVPSVGFFGFLSGDDDDEDVLGGGGKVFCPRGMKALRTSSAADSLPDSLGLGGDLDGLGAIASTDVIAFVVDILLVNAA